MVLQHARRDARVDGQGRLVPLPAQDRSRWRHDEVVRGRELVALMGDPVSAYHLEALIAAGHTETVTDWVRIAGLYARLEELSPSPVVRLNRAVAVAEAGSPEAALSLLDGLDAALPGHHLLPAARGEFLWRLGRDTEAAACFTAARDLARTDPERDHLSRRLAELTGECPRRRQ